MRFLFRERDIGTLCYRSVIVIISILLLTLSPVSVFAQATPTPQPPPSETQLLRQLTDLAQAVKDLSSNNGTTINTSVVLFGFGFILLMIFAMLLLWRFFKPLLDQIDAARTQSNTAHLALMSRIEAEDEKDRSNTRLRIIGAKSTRKVADAAVKAANLVSEVQTSVTNSTEAINSNLDAKAKATDEGLQRVETKVGELKEQVDQLATKADMKAQMEPIQEQINELIQQIIGLKAMSGVVPELTPALPQSADALAATAPANGSGDDAKTTANG